MAAAETTSSTTATPEQAPYELSAEKMMQDNLLVLGLIFFIFYFILIRPQQKRMKAHTTMMKSLQKGNKVLAAGGIIGTIAKFEGDEVVVLEVAQGVKIRVARASITEVLAADAPGIGETANDN